MKVGFVGNIAQNGWYWSKFLRQWTDIEAYCYYDGQGSTLQWPEWAEAVFEPKALREWQLAKGEDHPPIPIRTRGFELPKWALPMAWSYASEPPPIDYLQHAIMPLQALRAMPAWEDILHLAQEFDVLVLCGPAAAYASLWASHKNLRAKVVAFEHATMRLVHQRSTPGNSLLADAYQMADHCLITNADCIEAANALGIAHRSFTPHPVDTRKFSPGSDVAWRKHLMSFLPGGPVERIFLAPARHSAFKEWGLKGNDKIFQAFARYVHEAEPQGAPKACLVTLDYGDAVNRSRTFCAALEIQDRVIWFSLEPQMHLVRYYRAADVVLDQFHEDVGSYGTTVVEALACAKPAITYIDQAKHEWCQDVLPIPPVYNALTAREIYDGLRAIIKPWSTVNSVRAWVDEWHSPERVTRRMADLLSEVTAQPYTWYDDPRLDVRFGGWQDDQHLTSEPAPGNHPVPVA